MIDLKTASTQEIASYFSNEVNNLLFKPEKIAEEQKSSKQMIVKSFLKNSTMKPKN